MESQLSEGPAPLARALADIDWTRPWFSPFAAIGASLAAQVQAGGDARRALSAAAASMGLRNAAGHALRFVPQGDLPNGTAYETHIHDTGAVPTRDNLHDLFNGLVWLHYPLTKAALNRIQAQAIAAQGVGARRGAVRDAATLFDENAVLVVGADEPLEAALRGFRWRALFVDARAAWGPRVKVLPFGHALLEKLVSPYKAVTAHAWPVAVRAVSPDAAGGNVDDFLARQLADVPLHSRQFAPLPVMGIPGWCAANADPAFYDDATVFRPGRRQADATAQR
ncbi:DUF3025 domain-containing protein [Cupriavidus respiraculi]|uniref:Transmembrane protein n=1 Tax=Cupriavidus respiraculi TaxID=195930 RepID=A0ABM8X4C6_9BURK|nr:DUF3025 domain-containing protein [Cupriavidus respiraculi]CAG9174765.1 hypothetical protein LMG21510_02692 [Cupriavidus respiraculi]